MDAGGNPFDGEITDGQIERWLDQFEPDERPHVLRLVEQFHYYSSARFTRLLHSLPERIAAAANVDASDLTYRPVGQVGDSGSTALYLLGGPPAEEPNEAHDPGHVAVLLDDFIETGQQAAKVWADLDGEPRPAIFAAVVAVQAGVDYASHRSGFKIIAAETIPIARPLSPEAGIFDESERRAIAAIMDKYNQLLCPGLCAKAELGSLVGFFYNTPESTFPVFWAGTNGWQPLLPYRSPHEESGEEVETPGAAAESNAARLARREQRELSEPVLQQLLYEFHSLPLVTHVTPAFVRASMSSSAAFEFLELVRRLMHQVHEKDPVCSALLVVDQNHENKYAASSPIIVDDGLRLEEMDKAETIACVFDGLAGAMVVSPEGSILGSTIYDPSRRASGFLPSRYQGVLAASRHGLLALFLGLGRVQFFAYGQLIATHRGTAWHAHDQRALGRKLKELAKTHGIKPSVLGDMMRIAYLVSDQEKGAIVTVGDHERVLSMGTPSDADGYSWRSLPLHDSHDQALVGLMSQDKATIVTSDGTVLRGRVGLNPPAAIAIKQEPGKGNKLSTAAQVSAATNAVCFAISVDGRISLVSNGQVVWRTIV